MVFDAISGTSYLKDRLTRFNRYSETSETPDCDFINVIIGNQSFVYSLTPKKCVNALALHQLESIDTLHILNGMCNTGLALQMITD